MDDVSVYIAINKENPLFSFAENFDILSKNDKENGG
jgi:hypothetical protein